MPSEVKAPGGLKFDVVLKEPDQEAAKKRPTSPPSSKGTPKTLDHIQSKLKEAEERRKSLEATKIEKIAKHTKEELKEKQTKVQEINEAFAEAAKEDLTKKMSKFEENKKLQDKLREEKLQQMKEHQKIVRERKGKIGANGDASPTDDATSPTAE